MASPAAVDALLLRGDQIVAAVEQKSRNYSMERFRGEFEELWLMTYDKLLRAREVARSLGVPLYGFLYLVPDQTLLTKRLVGSDGEWTCRFDVRPTRTAATINGGSVIRRNAFIWMGQCSVLK